MLNTDRPWTEFTFVAFDTETSGAYPVGAEIVEFGAVKWQGGKEIGSLQFLLKPREPMSDFIIGIHGITNEMVASAPQMSEKIRTIQEFCQGAVLMAHHAPFDLGFLTLEFEKNHLTPPESINICTSLLARKLIPESPNHKLQTLIKVLKIDGGQAHRALDDARACLMVGLECMHRMGSLTPLSEVVEKVGKDLAWRNYFILGSAHLTIKKIVEALEHKKSLDIIYDGGSQIKETRRITPTGLVRNPDGDYVAALCHRDNNHKRFYVNKIRDCAVVY